MILSWLFFTLIAFTEEETVTVQLNPQKVVIPEKENFGLLSQSAYSIDRIPRYPLHCYEPQVGDIVLFSNPTLFWSSLYLIAGTAAPGHAGLVVRMQNGRLGIVEAGYNDGIHVRLNPLSERLPIYPGHLWIRQRKQPVTEEQSNCLTQYATAIDGKCYSGVRLLGQLTPLRSRGPLRTYFVGRPKGIRHAYICSEAVLEGLVYAGLLDKRTTRPSATFPRDMFFDSSLNPYINKHLHLISQWEVPALWQRGSSCFDSHHSYQDPISKK